MKIKFTEKEWIELNNGSKGNDNSPKVQNKNSFGGTSSQTEISDEDIDKEAELYQFTDGVNSFKFAIQWYREQLKKL